MPLNYYAIGKALGGAMVPGQRVRFGNFGRVRLEGESRRHYPQPEPKVELTLDNERDLAAAFEEMRNGHATDRLLWDGDFAKRFYEAARAHGVHAPASTLTRRLINIRKNPTRYAKQGIILSSSTANEPQPSIIPRFAHAVEFALVRMRVRYNVSIDDILIDPNFSRLYVNFASQMAPGLTANDLRLGALYIRKSRFLRREDKTLFDHLDPQKIEPKLSCYGAFSQLRIDDVPSSEGIIEVREESTRFLYITRTNDLRCAARELVHGPALSVMSNHFWKPDRDSLVMSAIAGKDYDNISLRQWQLKLIAAHEPVFNWPIKTAA
ncbi:MAG: hypothetical protein IT440_05315 [Phycisphaeraceae bacterium]|nr:hypothetical protein [Phycisphaeraceae bacterium]